MTFAYCNMLELHPSGSLASSTSTYREGTSYCAVVTAKSPVFSGVF